MPRFIYGDSYGDVANRELSTDAARDARYFNSLAANRAAQAQQLQAGQAQAGNQLAWQQLLQAAAENADRMNFSRERAGADQSIALLGLKDQSRRDSAMDAFRLADLGLRKRALDFQTSPDVEGDADYDELLRGIGQGYFDRSGTSDIAKLFPALNSNRLARAGAFVDARRGMLGEQDTAAENQAQLLNDQLQAMKRNSLINTMRVNKGEAQRGPNLPRLLGGAGIDSTIDTEFNANVAKLSAGQMDESVPPLAPGDLQKFLSAVAKNPKVSSLVSFDESQQVFKPVKRFASEKPTASRATIIKYDPVSGRPIAYDAETKRPVGYAD